ncbi:MAG TPA: hypothetical protein VGQ29_02480 [Gemmatimonadales bacterium]|nr:hypothetical protein [Gemmatimonadales bacterium]
MRSLPPMPPDATRWHWLAAVALVMAPALLAALALLVRATR